MLADRRQLPDCRVFRVRKIHAQTRGMRPDRWLDFHHDEYYHRMRLSVEIWV